MENLEQENYAASNMSLKEIISQENKMLKRMPSLIQELVKQKFPIQFSMEDGVFSVGDFYKTGVLKLVLDEDDNLVAFDKEGNKGIITTVEQIIRLNYHWFVASKTKQGYPQLTKHWSDLFRDRKWLKVVYTYIPDLDAFEESKQETAEQAEQPTHSQEQQEQIKTTTATTATQTANVTATANNDLFNKTDEVKQGKSAEEEIDFSL